jgi:hypothetical protein
MTEEEWQKCDDPAVMLSFLKKASARKLRLFAVGCCRQIWRLIRRPECQRAVETGELYADRRVNARRLREAEGAARLRATELEFEAQVTMLMGKYAARDAAYAAADAAGMPLMPLRAAYFARQAVTATSDRPKSQTSLLRDLFGNPFRPKLSAAPHVLGWGEGVVPKLARAVYDDRRFADLPILADALEEAGCTAADVLAHCRAGGEHARGCWVVDLLLDKR